jgi:hypothetical protein
MLMNQRFMWLTSLPFERLDAELRNSGRERCSICYSIEH